MGTERAEGRTAQACCLSSNHSGKMGNKGCMVKFGTWMTYRRELHKPDQRMDGGIRVEREVEAREK